MFAFLRSRPSALLGREVKGPAGVDTPLLDTPLLDTLADARDVALTAADASFTPERAAAQRAAIMARLGASDDPRVLSFPPRALEATPAVRRGASPRPALGWMLTAAAAGLVVGVGTGQGLYDWQPGDWQPGRPAVTQGRAATTPAAIQPVLTDLDDAILGEVEFALAERGVDELQPLDALTPRVTLVASR
jgi:hypothetical protein